MTTDKESALWRVKEILGLINWSCLHQIRQGSEMSVDPYVLILSAVQDVYNLQHPKKPIQIEYSFEVSRVQQ